MNAVWGPGVRDTAIGGLATLLNRPLWRDSDAGAAIAAAVSAALSDTNPVVRRQAARAAGALHASASAADRAAALGELLLAEPHDEVRAVLLGQLAADVRGAPQVVDGILERYIRAGNSELKVTGILTQLALVPRTRFATELIAAWCADAPAHPQAVKIFAQHARHYIEPTSDAGQELAFDLLNIAADAARARWTRDPSEHLATAELAEHQVAQLRGAAEIAESIAQQIYFASGAFADKQGHHGGTSADLAGFADLAFPVLATCAALGLPHCIHEAVQTMVFLAPLDERRALHAIADAIPAAGPYAAELLAGDLTIPYLVSCAVSSPNKLV